MRAASQRLPCRILLAEDEEMIRRTAAFGLGREGWSVEAHPDGKSAWEAFRNGEADWDLLLTDLEMPGMDGQELSRMVRDRRPDLPVLVLTGHGPDELAALSLPAGARIVTKPFRLEELVAAIRRELPGA